MAPALARPNAAAAQDASSDRPLGLRRPRQGPLALPGCAGWRSLALAVLMSAAERVAPSAAFRAGWRSLALAVLMFAQATHAQTLSPSPPASAPPATPPSAAESVAALEALAAHYDAWRYREFPELALARGDYSHADRITDERVGAIDRRRAERVRMLERLRAVDRAALPADERLNYDLLKLELRWAIEEAGFRTHLAPVHGRQGPQQRVPQMHERVRFASREDYKSYLTRLELTPGAIDATIERMRLGLGEGRTPPQVVLAGVSAQFDALLGDSDRDAGAGLRVLAEPLAQARGVIGAQAAALGERFERDSYPRVHAALVRLRDFFVREYLPGCRATIAASDLPEGPAYYAFMLRTMTTTELSAQEIYDIGQREVARIRAEMMDVIRASDFLKRRPEAREHDDEQLFRVFIEYLRTDPRFYHDSPEALLTGYRDICKRIDATLPKLFGALPRLPYGVRAIPDFMAPTQTTGYYQQGDIRNAEPGYFYANAYALDQRPKYEMVALAMHEAVPGHHLQIALAQELEGLPAFRREGYLSAFGEGWALYSERLGLEVGLYDDPYDNFGRLLYEMWRACRLVVDPGMHAFGWPRERAIRFMLDNTALSELNIRNEIDRYIAWPGQACSYKIGELKIRALRRRAEEKLGARFDLRAFHDQILGAGPLPLTLLEARIDACIDAALATDRATNPS